MLCRKSITDRLTVGTMLKVALLYGGRSSEREISIASSKTVENAIGNRYEVVCIDTGEFDWVEKLIAVQCDVVFVCLHGMGGEDGSVQGVCESLGLPYTGSGVQASAMAMDKAIAKLVVSNAGVRTPASVAVKSLEGVCVEALLAQMNGKVVVKPEFGGSSVGLCIEETAEGLRKALEGILALGETALVEQYVLGRELTVSVHGGFSVESLPIIEIISCNEAYDYEAKYNKGMSRHVCPADISDSLSEECADMACRAHVALGCRGFSRSDFLLTEKGEIWYLETNTIPGMTETSLLPDAASAAGISYEALCDLMIVDALNEAGE